MILSEENVVVIKRDDITAGITALRKSKRKKKEEKNLKNFFLYIKKDLQATQILLLGRFNTVQLYAASNSL